MSLSELAATCPPPHLARVFVIAQGVAVLLLVAGVLLFRRAQRRGPAWLFAVSVPLVIVALLPLVMYVAADVQLLRICG